MFTLIVSTLIALLREKFEDETGIVLLVAIVLPITTCADLILLSEIVAVVTVMIMKGG
jgi:hypothetical protein